MSAAPGPRDAAPAIPSAAVEDLRRRLFDWYALNRRDLPWRRTTDSYAILVSEVMLQQTQVARVVPFYASFLDRFPTLAGLAAAALPEVLAAWMGLGYNNRAVRLKRCAEAVTGRLPDDVDGLLRLPGIGPYTARAVLIFAHNADLAAVDANVRRVLVHELDLDPGLPPAALAAVATAVLPRGRARDWHNALMDYGALVLTGRATGIASLSRQGTFAGSRRQYRARTLRLLLQRGPLPLEALPPALYLDTARVADVLAGLERDGLVVRSTAAVRLVEQRANRQQADGGADRGGPLRCGQASDDE